MNHELLIDKNSLDREIIRQPSILQRVSEEHALNISIRDAAYESLKVVDAELNLDIREKAALEGERVTEATISARVLTHPRHTKAHLEYLEAKKVADISQANREAWSQRGHALRDMAQLWLGQYYSSTSVSGVHPSEVRMSSSEARRSVTEAMEKRKREGERDE